LNEKEIYTKKDCIEAGSSCSIKGKVAVLNREALAPGDEGQLYFCLCGNGAAANPPGCAVFLVSLHTGAFSLKRRSEVIGVLKPELLPDSAKLRLSQIRPIRALELERHEPKYSGRCSLPDGGYTAGVWLYSEQEARNYIEIQRRYQHRVMICNRDDFCVLEMVEGKLLQPAQRERKQVRVASDKEI
jgi:hypothetical protein